MPRVKAISKYVKVSSRKARLVADQIRNRTIEEANAFLMFCHQKSGRLLKKTLDSAVAGAELQYDLRREDMKILEVRVDEGPVMKRIRPRNRGGRHPILKRTSHFTIVVGKE